MADGPSCAHLKIEYQTRGYSGIVTEVWWECSNCQTHFIPESELRTAREENEAHKGALRGMLMAINPVGWDDDVKAEQAVECAIACIISDREVRNELNAAREEIERLRAFIPPHIAPGDLYHGRNCAALSVHADDADCTCGLVWRKHLQTEQEMHNAWRKRAEEVEQQHDAAIQQLTAEQERGSQLSVEWSSALDTAIQREAKLRKALERMRDVANMLGRLLPKDVYADNIPILDDHERANYAAEAALAESEAAQGKGDGE